MKDYVIDRDNALKTFEVSELIKFMEKHEREIGSDVVARFKKADRKVQMATMCKMIANIPSLLKTDCWIKAFKWLGENNMSGDIL